MALQKQTIAIPFTSGLDTKTADIHVNPPGLLGLKNGVFDRTGSISKRKGFKKLTKKVLEGGTAYYRDVAYVFPHRDQLVARTLASGKYGHQVYNTGTQTWVSNIGGWTATQPMESSVRVREVPNISIEWSGSVDPVISYQDCACANGYAIFSWKIDATSTADEDVYVSVLHIESGSWPLVFKQANSTSYATKVRCVGYDKYLFVLWLDATADLQMSVIDTDDDPTSFYATEDTLKTTVDKFDVCTDTTQGLCFYHTAGGNVYAMTFDHTGVTNTSAGAADAVGGDLGCGCDTSGRMYTLVDNTYRVYTISSLALAASGGVGGALAPVSPSKVCGSTESSDRCIFFSQEADTADYYNNRLALIEIEPTAPSGANWSNLYGVTGLSRPFKCSDTDDREAFAVLFQHVDDLQRTIQAAPFDVNGRVAIFAPGESFGEALFISNQGEFFSNWGKSGDRTYMFAYPTIVANRYDIDNSVTGLKAVEITVPDNAVDMNFEDRLIPSYTRLGKTTLLSGGSPKVYDGSSMVNHSLDWYPEEFAVSGKNAAGSLTDGTYSVKLVYVWFSSEGERYESAPSPAQEVTLAVGEDTIELDFPISQQSTVSNIVIEVYRTLVGGSTYYMCYAEEINTAGSVDTVDLEYADSVISDNRILYTDGGVLSNRPLPECRCLITRRDRVFAATGDFRIVYSKKRANGYGEEFPAEFYIDMDNKHGRITGLAEMDGRVIVFAERGIYYFDGDGPNDLGQGSFTDVRDIVSPVGHIEGSPTTTTAQGTYFVSVRGIELLGRDLQVQFVGLKVQNAITGNITGIVNKQADDELWFFTDSGDSLVYDTFHGEWSASTMPNAKNACLWNGEDIAVCQVGSGEVYVSDDVYTDGGIDYQFQIDTAWFALDKAQGLQRVYWVSLIGEYESPHMFVVDTYYDYDETIVDTFTLAVDKDPNPHQIRFKPSRQKCQSIRFRIRDMSPSGTRGSFSLSHLQMQLGVKGGTFRLPPAQTR